jgi:hypothetical protein
MTGQSATDTPAISEIARLTSAGPSGSWFGNARRAADVAASQPQLWVAGALAALAFLGWLPFLLAIAPIPTVADLAFFVSSLWLAPSFPMNAIVLGSAAALVVVAASVMVATCEAAVVRATVDLDARRGMQRALDDDASRAWLVQLIAALPCLAALVATGLAIAGVAPAEYQSPDLGTPLVLRILLDVWPWLAAALVLALLGQAFASAAQRASIVGRRGLAGAIAAGALDLVRHPIRRALTALVTAFALAAWLVISWALLHVLWAPLGRSIAQGALLENGSPFLLAGFVATWLCLVAASGVLAAWASAWWSLEVTGRWS